jgi:hypothetical protein
LSLFLFKLPSSTYDLPPSVYINMANTRKPAPKLPSANTRSTKENNQPRSFTATRVALAPKPFQTQASLSNGVKDSGMGNVKDAETAALLASLRG